MIPLPGTSVGPGACCCNCNPATQPPDCTYNYQVYVNGVADGGPQEAIWGPGDMVQDGNNCGEEIEDFITGEHVLLFGYTGSCWTITWEIIGIGPPASMYGPLTICEGICIPAGTYTIPFTSGTNIGTVTVTFE